MSADEDGIEVGGQAVFGRGGADRLDYDRARRRNDARRRAAEAGGDAAYELHAKLAALAIILLIAVGYLLA